MIDYVAWFQCYLYCNGCAE